MKQYLSEVKYSGKQNVSEYFLQNILDLKYCFLKPDRFSLNKFITALASTVLPLQIRNKKYLNYAVNITGVLTTMSKIYDGAFFVKIANDF